MNIALWIAAGLLAFAFTGAGLLKLLTPKDQLVAKGQAWAQDFPPAAVKAIGALEVLGAVGLVLPAALGIATVLTPLAAAGLAVLMLGAAATHTRRKEFPALAPNLVLIALAVFVAVGRFGAYAL